MKAVSIRVETTLGAVYEFPDVDPTQVTKGHLDFWVTVGSITLANISNACLIVPFRIVAALYIDGEKKWPFPA